MEDKYNRPELFPEEIAQMEAEREEKGLHRKKERRDGADKEEEMEAKVKGTFLKLLIEENSTPLVCGCVCVCTFEN
jgi:hypothetical protein